MKSKKYTFDEVLAAATEYFKGDSLAANIWTQKYALKDSQGNLYERTPDDMHHRLASEFARIEAKYPNPLSEETIYELLKDFKYIVPQGSPMAGIGNNFQILSISNCFVTGELYDSYGGILWTDQQLAQLYKRRCGVGTDVSHIRPKSTKVTNAALTTTGVLPFMDRYSNTTREVAMEGRRGALLLSYHIKGMDATDFITAKRDRTKVTGANISVKVSDEFIKAVKEDGMFTQQFPIDSDKPLYTRSVKARDLWNKIVHNAWADAEPGVLLWDTIAREAIGDCYTDEGFKTVSTNPCGEIPLCVNDSCRLLLINLFNYIVDPFSANPTLDLDLLIKHAIIAERLMDDIVDLELEKIDLILSKVASDPEPDYIKMAEIMLWTEIRKKAVQGRRTGLGLTALGDMIAAMNLQYGTTAATEFATTVVKNIALASYRSSVTMAKERGAFPIYERKKEAGNPFLQRLFDADPELKSQMMKYGRRGISLNTISPAGSVSIVTQTSSGIEPMFALRYKRRRKVNPSDSNVKIVFTDKNGDHWEEYEMLHPPYAAWLTANGYDIAKVIAMSPEEFKAIAATSPYHNSSATDIDWREKVKMQGALQKWIDHSISNTTNLPATATEQDISDLYMLAWEHGCKGVTVYREGSRDGVLLSSDKEEKKKDPMWGETHAKKRPKDVECEVIRFMNNSEKWIGFLGILDGRPYEIFTGLADDFPIPTYVEKGKVRRVKDNGHGSRYDFLYFDRAGLEQEVKGLNRVFNKTYWNYAKMVSGLMRHGMPTLYIVHLLESLNLDDSINTWFNGVIRVIKRYIKDGTTDAKAGACPVCGSTLQYSEGCLKCPSCGEFSKCG